MIVWLPSQVLLDVAKALDAAAKMNVLHRDVTPGNFGHVNGRGILYDWSAGKVRHGLLVEDGMICQPSGRVVTRRCRH